MKDTPEMMEKRTLRENPWKKIEEKLNKLYCVYYGKSPKEEVMVCLEDLMKAYDDWLD